MFALRRWFETDNEEALAPYKYRCSWLSIDSLQNRWVKSRIMFAYDKLETWSIHFSFHQIRPNPHVYNPQQHRNSHSLIFTVRSRCSISQATICSHMYMYHLRLFRIELDGGNHFRSRCKDAFKANIWLAFCGTAKCIEIVTHWHINRVSRKYSIHRSLPAGKDRATAAGRRRRT